MASKPDPSVTPRTSALAILARIIAHDILRKARIGNGRLEMATNVTDNETSENNADTNDEDCHK
jgi:hypothetical protein